MRGQKAERKLSKRAQTVLDNHGMTLDDLKGWKLQHIRFLRGCGLKTAMELDVMRPDLVDWMAIVKAKREAKKSAKQ